MSRFWGDVLLLVGIFAGLIVYEKARLRYHWSIREARRQREARRLMPATWRVQVRRSGKASEPNLFGVASQGSSGRAWHAGADSRATRENSESRENG